MTCPRCGATWVASEDAPDFGLCGECMDEECNCGIPYLEGAGQHAPGCAAVRADRQAAQL